MSEIAIGSSTTWEREPWGHGSLAHSLPPMDKKMVGGCDEMHAGSGPEQAAVSGVGADGEGLPRYGVDKPSYAGSGCDRLMVFPVSLCCR
jgi:hypothetical protein